MSLVQCPAHDNLRRPRHVSAVRELSYGRPNQPDGAVLSAARAGLRRLLPGSVAGVREAGAHLHRVRVLLIVFDVLGRACAPLLRNDQGSAQSRRQQPGVRDRQQRRISAAALPAARRARDGIEPAANVAEVARRKNIPTLVEFFGLALAQRLVSEGRRRPISSSATTCWRRCRTSTTSSAAWRIFSRPMA